MASGTAADEVVIIKRPLWQRIAKWILIALATLLALMVVLIVGLNTSPGRRLVANLVGGYSTASGLNIKVGRIDGSLYGKMTLVDLRVSDPKGVFLTSPRIAVDWRPFAFVNNHVDVRSAVSDRIIMSRSPALKPVSTDPNAPTLPDIDIDVGRLQVSRFVLGPAVSGQTQVLSIDGQTHIADRRAQLTADVNAIAGRGIAGGDRMHAVIDAVPDDDKLNVDISLVSPARGLVASMAGLTAPLDFKVGGKGSWKAWGGRATGTLGGLSFADLGIEAHAGTFKVRGNLHPGLYPGGAPKDQATPANPIARLTAPQLDVALDATLGQRLADVRFTMASEALAARGQGRLDLGNSRLGGFRIDARLIKTGAILPNLAGRNVAASVVLDGPFATPTVNYAIDAAAIGINGMTVEQLHATGLAKVNTDRILIPVSARAARISGLNPAVGGLLDNVAIDGDLAFSGDTILSDNLKIRSRKIDATAIVIADLSQGAYRGALKGRVNDYRVEGIGIVNLTTDAKLVTTANGFGITGRVVAQTSQIFNAGARSFLGGNAFVAANVGYDPKGFVSFNDVRLNAPQFRVTRGQGRYELASGAVAVDADAYSSQYGPLFARVSGTATQPVVLLRAPRPGVGIGLVNLEARLKGSGAGYAVTASGGTNYGPFTADVLVTTGRALTVDIHKAVFAGIGITGRVQQLPAGPFAGTLAFNGSGVSGVAKLGAKGSVQRADINARAFNAKIPGAAGITIGRALITASVVMNPGAPQVIADAQVANLQYGPTVIQAGRVKVNYVNGSGTAQALLTGSNSVPFRLAANAKLSPKLWVAALQGQANGINFKTGTPARIEIGNGSHLLPTRIDFDQGVARVAGRFGGGSTVAQLRLDRLDLSVANALVPGLGLGGTATGSLDYTQSGKAVPHADARMTIANFTRSSLSAVSEPVDVIFQGNMTGTNAEARALIKRGPTAVGRMVATVGGGSTLMTGNLGGGIRYSGPAAVLFSFGGFANQTLTGPIALAADFGGQVAAPRLNGAIRADSLTYDNETYGTRLSQMKIAGRFNNDRLELTQVTARAGQGSVQAQGTVGLAAAAGFPIDIRAKLDNAQLAKSDAIGATATGTVEIINGPQTGGLIRGDIQIPQARYEIIRQGQAEVPELTGVRRKSDLAKAAAQGPGVGTTTPSSFKLDVRVRAEDQLYVSGMGLESEWRSDLKVSGTSKAPVVTGRIELVRGTYTFSGKRFDLNTGVITFDGGSLTNPTINISASTDIEDVTAVLNITGTAQNPRIAFTSTPSLPQDEVLSRILFGSSVTNLSATEAIQLAAALNGLRGGGGGLNPLGKLRSATGLDRLRILGADQTSGRGTSLAAGKYITDDIYVEVITDARGFTATQLEIALSKGLSLLSQAGSFGGSNVTVRYKRDF